MFSESRCLCCPPPPLVGAEWPLSNSPSCHRATNFAMAFACFLFFFREGAVSSSKTLRPTRYLFLSGAAARHLRSQDLMCVVTSSKSAGADREKDAKAIYLLVLQPRAQTTQGCAHACTNREHISMFSCVCRLTRGASALVRRRIIRLPLAKVLSLQRGA